MAKPSWLRRLFSANNLRSHDGLPMIQSPDPVWVAPAARSSRARQRTYIMAAINSVTTATVPVTASGAAGLREQTLHQYHEIPQADKTQPDVAAQAIPQHARQENQQRQHLPSQIIQGGCCSQASATCCAAVPSPSPARSADAPTALPRPRSRRLPAARRATRAPRARHSAASSSSSARLLSVPAQWDAP